VFPAHFSWRAAAVAAALHKKLPHPSLPHNTFPDTLLRTCHVLFNLCPYAGSPITTSMQLSRKAVLLALCLSALLLLAAVPAAEAGRSSRHLTQVNQWMGWGAGWGSPWFGGWGGGWSRPSDPGRHHEASLQSLRYLCSLRTRIRPYRSMRSFNHPKSASSPTPELGLPLCNGSWQVVGPLK
jgi:hypothetical protein